MNAERTSTNTKMKLMRLQKKIYEIKKTPQDMKEELNKDMENLRKRIKLKSWK
jgi:hypothetical protein